MNNISYGQRIRAAGVVTCTAILIVGCASLPPPTEQMAVSQSAITNAVSAQGHEFAPVEMRSAQEKMERANQAVAKEDYVRARWLAEEAQTDARLAEKKSHSAKAQKAAIAMQDDIRVLREEINRNVQ